MKKPEINWRELGADDYIARYNGYDLHIEAMDRNLWWFQIYHYGEPMIHENNFVFTKQEAERIILAEVEALKKAGRTE